MPGTKHIPIIQTQDLNRTYTLGTTKVHALKSINLTIEKNECVAITGSSGSGKSTLMHIIGCLDKPTSGKYLLQGVDVANMTNDELATIRNKKIGFVFQRFHLLPDLTATDNVALPLLYAGVSEQEAIKKAQHHLALVDLSERVQHYPYQLSGGQQQRVAIARSLVNSPSIVLADEPTGNLDSASGKEIMSIFMQLHQEQEVTIILVTHESAVAQQAERIIELVDGAIVKDAQVS